MFPARALISVVLPSLVAAGCVSTAPQSPPETVPAAPESASERIVFPPPPAPAVIRWQATYREDFEGETSSRLRKILVGEEETRRVMALSHPTAVAIGGDGTLYVADQRFGGVAIINEGRGQFDRFTGDPVGGFAEPVGIAMDAQDTLYVSDAGSGWVYAFDGELRLKNQYGGPSVFGRQTAIAVSDDGERLAVCDTKKHQVVVFDTVVGAELMTLGAGSPSAREGEFHYPVSVAYDDEGFLYVCDYLNFRVQIFDPSGDVELVFGEAGDRPGNFARPRGIAADSANGVIYVTDAAFNRVQMFNLDGELLMWFGQMGNTPATFHLPTGITRRGDQILVADTMNNRVQLFRFLGVPEE